ncbi:membrane protein [Planctomycetota bacterium]|nr:membrane protein [Planctomycetota bacterium]
MSLTSIAVLTVTGALIGWATNWVALKMLFHPRKPFLGLRGLLPRRQAQLAKDVGRIIANELVDTNKLLAGLDTIDLQPRIAQALDAAIATKLTEYQQIPLIGSFITKERVQGIRDALLVELVKAQPALLASLKDELGKRIDIGRVAEEKLATFDLDRLETVVNTIANREFRAIEWCGAILGGLIGLIQAVVMPLIS